MLNYWVNESWVADVTEFLIQKLSAVFATESSLELGGDECDNNLNFTNFKLTVYKIRKSSWILGTFEIRKIRILNLCALLSAIPVYSSIRSLNNKEPT